jgi:probable F420-dependent oxidoreductase
MKIWQNLGFTPANRLVDLAVAAEGAGMHGVTLPEHLATPTAIETPNPYVPSGGTGYAPDTPFIDPFIAFGAIASRTTTLHLLANVYVLPLRNIFVAAKSVSSTAVLSNDRLVLGVGIGWLREEFAAVGADFAMRGRRADEMLDLLARLLRGDAVAADSALHRFAEVRIAPVPTRPVPVLVGGESAAALRRAARADGWIGVNYTEDALVPILRRLRDVRDAAGDGARPFEIVVSRPPDFDAAMARRYERAGVTGIVNRPTIFTVGDDAGVDEHAAVMRSFVDLVHG